MYDCSVAELPTTLTVGSSDAYVIAEELEQAALEELRSFIRAHEAAQFLL
jgi:hypothetical protein